MANKTVLSFHSHKPSNEQASDSQDTTLPSLSSPTQSARRELLPSLNSTPSRPNKKSMQWTAGMATFVKWIVFFMDHISFYYCG